MMNNNCRLAGIEGSTHSERQLFNSWVLYLLPTSSYLFLPLPTSSYLFLRNIPPVFIDFHDPALHYVHMYIGR